MSIEIIPSLLVQSEEAFRENIQSIQNLTSIIQIDIADGVFVASTPWADPQVTQETVESDIELHLMVKQPLTELERWQNVGRVKRVYFHFEAVDEQQRENVIEAIRDDGYEVGIALRPETPIEVLEPYKNEIDAILFLSVEPGAQGRPFQKEVLEKIKNLRSRGWNHFVAIDGGVNQKNISEVIVSGVDAICLGSALFGAGNPKENLEKIQQLISEK